MSSDNDYRIRIQTVGDPSGAQAVAGALDKTTGATQEATKATEKHTAGLHAMHNVFHALNEVVPGLGVLMQAAFSPIGATISLAVLLMRVFHEETKKVNEELKRMEEDNAKPLTRRLEAMREGTVSTASALAELREKLEHTAHSERGVREEIEKTLETQKRQIELAHEVADANKGQELAGLEAMHEAGLLSDERYFAAKLAAEEKYRKKKRELEEAEEMRGILAQRRALELAEINQPGLTAKAEAAVGGKQKALEDLASLRPKAEIDDDKKKTGEALKAFEDKYPQWSRWFEDFGVSANPVDVSAKLGTRENLSAFQASGGFHGMVGGPGLSEAYTEWVRLKTSADAADASWKQGPGEEARRKVAADKATAAAERAEKKALENQDLIDEYHRTLPEKTGAFKERAAANAEADRALNDVARQKMKGTPDGAAVAGGAEALQRLMGGGKWDLTKGGDVGEINNLLSLARLLSSMPARERNHPEPHDRTGLNFGQAERTVFQDSACDVAMQGKQLDSTSQQANAELVRLLSGLHGLQAQTLRTIASHADNTEQLARDLDGIQRRIESQARAVSLSNNQNPGN